MNQIAPISSLSVMVKTASERLASATSAAEILEASELAGQAYDQAKRAARIGKAKQAHDELIAKAHRAQADALEIEAQAKRRLADEYDAAQERGEIAKGRPKSVTDENTFQASAADLGLTRKEVHDARRIRDAEEADPGIVRRTLDERLERGEEPTKAALREVVTQAAMRGIRGAGSSTNRNPHYVPPTPDERAWSHVNGTCRAFAEWATDENIASAARGHRSDEFQAMNTEAVIRAHAALSRVLEAINAE